MDFKGITWAGNIYQKFETMCLEVEEVMYEDTIKYVENQVQKVGVSVKKFYSEVMHDLLPPSSVDPLKVAAGDSSSNPYSQTELSRCNSIMLESLEELKQKETKDEDISDIADEVSSLGVCNDANHLSLASSRDFVETTYSDVCPTKSKKLGVFKRPIGIKRISRNNHPPNLSSDMTCLSGNMRSSCLVASDDISVATSSELLVGYHPGEAVKVDTPVSDASEKITLAESVMQEKLNGEYDSCASGKIVSAESVRSKKDDSHCISSYHVLTSKPIDNFRTNGSFSHLNPNIGNNTCNDESVAENVIFHYEDNFDMEIVDNEEAVEPRVAILEPIENSNLEGTCILIEADKLHFASQGKEKHKSYKKKIREALSSKLRSTRKQDLCISRYKYVGGKNNQALTMESDKRNCSVHDSFESDWELL